jgi:hypothetical protein
MQVLIGWSCVFPAQNNVDVCRRLSDRCTAPVTSQKKMPLLSSHSVSGKQSKVALSHWVQCHCVVSLLLQITVCDSTSRYGGQKPGPLIEERAYYLAKLFWSNHSASGRLGSAEQCTDLAIAIPFVRLPGGLMSLTDFLGSGRKNFVLWHTRGPLRGPWLNLQDLSFKQPSHNHFQLLSRKFED